MVLANGVFKNLKGRLEDRRRPSMVPGMKERGTLLLERFGVLFLCSFRKKLDGFGIVVSGHTIGCQGRFDVSRGDRQIRSRTEPRCARLGHHPSQCGDSRARLIEAGDGFLEITVREILDGLTEGDEVILSDTSSWDAYDRIRLD